MSRFKTIGKKLDLKFGNDINDNFGTSDSEFTRVDGRIDDTNARSTQIEQDAIDRHDSHVSSTTAHDSTDITYTGNVNANNVKDALDTTDSRVSEIIAGQTTSDSSIINEVVDSRTGADGTARTALGDLTREIHGKQLKQDDTKQTLTHGTQIINGSQASPVKPTFYGETRTNHGGEEGGFHKQGKWDSALTIDTSTYKFGTSSGKIDNSAGTSGKASNNGLKMYLAGKYILSSLHMKSVSGTPSVSVYLLRYDSVGTYLGAIAIYQGTITNQWGFYNSKIDLTANTDDHFKVRLVVESYGTADDVVNFDGLIVEELTSEQFNDIGVSKTDEDVIREHSYIDSVKSVKNPVLSVEGDNLNDTFYAWDEIHSDASIISSYDLELNATSTGYKISSTKIEVVSSTQYSVSYTGTGAMGIDEYDSSGNVIKTNTVSSASGTELSFTTTSTTKEISVKLYNGGGNTGTYTFKNVMLNLGSTAKPFTERNPSYVIAETTLAGNANKKDILSQVDGAWYKEKKWETDVKLDGSLTWTFERDYVGIKRVTTTFTNVLDKTEQVVKYDGKIIRHDSGVNDSDESYLRGSDGKLFLVISDTDTGFDNSYKPTSDEWKGYFYGWKVNGYTTGTTITDEATGSLADAGTYTFAYAGRYRNVVVEKSSDNSTWSSATEGTDYSLDIGGTSAVLKNISGGSLYFRIDYVYGTDANSWQNIVDGSAPSTNSLAYVSANMAPGFSPYELTYELADSVTEQVKVEGSVSIDGLAQASVDSGVVWEETVTPHVTSGLAVLNNTYYTTSLFNYRGDTLIKITKDGIDDSDTWAIKNGTGANGNFSLETNEVNFDSTATYKATYLVYNSDKYTHTTNVIELPIWYNKNIRGSVDDLVRITSDQGTQISVNKNAIIDLYARVKTLESYH